MDRPDRDDRGDAKRGRPALPPRLADAKADAGSLEARVAEHLRRVYSVPAPGADMLARVAARLPGGPGRARVRRPRWPRLAWASLGLAATAFAWFALRPPLRAWMSSAAEVGEERGPRAFGEAPRLVPGRALPPAAELSEPAPPSGEALVPLGAEDEAPPRDRAVKAGSPRPCRGFVPGADLQLCGATYVGGPGVDSPAAVEILPGEEILLAGNFDDGAFTAAGESSQVRSISHGGAPGAGAILRFGRAGRQLLAATRVGQSVTDMELDRGSGDIVLAGEPFGVIVLEADAATVRWQRPLRADRVAITAEGTVAALDTRTGHVSILQRGGASLGDLIMPAGVTAADVAIDGPSATVVVTGVIPGQPSRPFLRGFAFDGSTKWTAWDFSSSELKERKLTAGSWGTRVNVGRDGKLLLAGVSNGGNSAFFRAPTEIGKRLPYVAWDRYTRPDKVGNQSVLFIARLGPADGTLEVAQFGLTREEGPAGRGKSMNAGAITSDEAGNVYVGGYQTGVMEGEGAKTVNGVGLVRSRRDAFALVLTPDLGKRLLWTTFGTGAPSVGAVIVAGSGLVALVATQERAAAGQPLVTHEAIQSVPGGGASDAYLAVWPAP